MISELSGKDALAVFRGYNKAPRRAGHFRLCSPFQPAGDQPKAIENLVQGVLAEKKNQVLLGVTGSGKTFTMANVIERVQKTTLILAPNKTLAAQLYGEMRCFFPYNAVEYFVSYYDYYQPEAYIPSSNTYIEKESMINENIERMRHSATRALLERQDVVVVASVSCIYGLGAIEAYQEMSFTLKKDQSYGQSELLRELVKLHYKRNDIQLKRGTFRVRGDRVDIFPSHYESHAWSVSFFGRTVESIHEIDILTGQIISPLASVTLFPNSHYVAPGPTISQAIIRIEKELETRVQNFQDQNKLIEAQRLKERVTYDLESLKHTGLCAGIENYSRYLTGRPPGCAPPTLFEYLPSDALFIVDESHVSVPQVRGMVAGDNVRKKTLAEYGFRLPSCVDNRPLNFEEWDMMRPCTVFVSATPGPWELQETTGEVIEQVIRPTGLLDPVCTIHPTANQIDDLIGEIRKVVAEGERVLVTTLTKKMAEDLCGYFDQAHLNARYMHSDVETLERIRLLEDLRKGTYDVLIGINLLREGLDIPQCQLVAILDADRQGYLRSQTSLIQTIGRAARNVRGRVILYADTITPAMKGALEETERRRTLQQDFNQQHHITPKGTYSAASAILDARPDHSETAQESFAELNVAMLKAAEDLDFEKAAQIRDLLQKKRYS